MRSGRSSLTRTTAPRNTSPPAPQDRVVGDYCEKRDLQLSFLAYKRGMCDDELVDDDATGLFSPHRDQAAVDYCEESHIAATRSSFASPRASRVCLARGVYLGDQHVGRIQNVAERCYGEAMHTRPLNSSSIHLQTSRGSQRVPGAPRPAPCGRWRGVQGQLDAHVQGKQRKRSSGWRRSARLIVNPDEHGLVDKNRKKEEAASASLIVDCCHYHHRPHAAASPPYGCPCRRSAPPSATQSAAAAVTLIFCSSALPQ